MLLAAAATIDLELLQNAYASTDEALDASERQLLADFWNAFGATWQPALTEPPVSDGAPLTTLLTLWDYLLPDAPETSVREANHA